jgi:acyl dehydratase
LHATVGPETAVFYSRWRIVDQATIDRFAELTGDNQFIHVDEERAKRSGFDATIAHGFLALSLVPTLFSEAIVLPDEDAITINYGLDRLRFTSPIPNGSKVRARFDFISHTRRAPNETLLKYAVTLEVENQNKPAMVADWLIVKREPHFDRQEVEV